MPLWGLSSLEAVTLEEVFEETTVPTLETESAPPWPGRVCLESRERGAGSVPESDGRGQRPTELPLPAPEAITALLLDLGEGELPALATLHPHQMCPKLPPRFLLRLLQRPRLVFPTRVHQPLLSLHIHLLCFAGDAAREETEEWEPLPNPGRCHCLMPTFLLRLCKLTRIAWGRAGWKTLAWSVWRSEWTE